MIVRIVCAVLIFVIVSIVLLVGYGWALLVSIISDPGRIKDYYEDTGFWKQYRPVLTCLIKGPNYI